MLLHHRLYPPEDYKLTPTHEYIQELPRQQIRTGRELPVIEQPLAETEQPVGRSLNEQRMDKLALRSGTKKMLEMFLNLTSHASWNQNVTEEDIFDQKGAGQMKPGREKMKPRCLT